MSDLETKRKATKARALLRKNAERRKSKEMAERALKEESASEERPVEMEKWEEVDMGLADGWDAPGQHVRVYAESLPELWENIQEYLRNFKDTREISSASFETNKPGLTPAYDGKHWSVILTVHGTAKQETE